MEGKEKKGDHMEYDTVEGERDDRRSRWNVEQMEKKETGLA